MCRNEVGLAIFMLGRVAGSMQPPPRLRFVQAARGAWPVHRLKAREKLLTSANPSR
jgi:hypothetical protein